MVNIDVITYLHPEEKHLAHCIKGLLQQNVNFKWHLLCFHEPTDDLKDLPVQLHMLPATIKNKAQAYNFILPQLTAKYIAFNDADDASLPKRFEQQLQFLEQHPTINILGGGLIINDIHQGWEVQLNHTAIVKQMGLNNPMVNSTAMLRNKPNFWGVALRYNERLDRAEDYDFWLNCAKQNLKFANLAIPLISYRKGNVAANDSEIINARTIRAAAFAWYFKVPIADNLEQFYHAYAEKQFMFFWNKNKIVRYLKSLGY